MAAPKAAIGFQGQVCYVRQILNDRSGAILCICLKYFYPIYFFSAVFLNVHAHKKTSGSQIGYRKFMDFPGKIIFYRSVSSALPGRLLFAATI